jgi:hypothetical protein
MRVKCLGRVTPPHDIQVITAVPRPDYGDNKAKLEPFYTQYFTLGQKQYLPLSKSAGINKSKDFHEKFIKQSKKEPQPIVEIAKSKIAGSDSPKESTLGKLWLYNEKIYEFDRNDYDQQQVKLLILDFLEEERKEFAELKRKHYADRVGQ